MKYRCPHCANATISIWQKLVSYDLNPAICSSCGGASHRDSDRSGFSSSFTGMLAIFLGPLFLLLIFTPYFWVLGVITLVCVAFEVRKFHLKEMVVSDTESAKQKYCLVFVFLVVALVLILILPS